MGICHGVIPHGIHNNLFFNYASRNALEAFLLYRYIN